MRRRGAQGVGAFACSLAALLLCAATASAAPRYEVQIWPEGDPSRPNHVLLIASVDLGPSVKLPAKVRIPVPAGAEVSWAGEITGGSAENDIPRAYEITRVAGGRVLVMTLETTGNAQYDAWWAPLVFDGQTAAAKLEWVQTEPATEVGFTVRTPPGAGSVRIDPAPVGQPVQNAIGERLYTLPSQPMEPGDKLSLSLSFVPGGGAATPVRAGGESPVPYLIGVFVVLVVALAAVVAVEQRKRRDAEDA
ncbi:MAG: hypothetical protein C0418_00985 [Coriobacteriaceae bacterium]|nr:hypothetical protein [Coriobacteriaceae bacterium]